jgi:hypothetical protein
MTNATNPGQRRPSPAVPKPATTPPSRKAAGAGRAPTAAKPTLSRPKPSAEPGAAKAKPKLVRDSFTIPKAEYTVLEGLKVRAAKLARPTKKSELLRAGIAALAAMKDRAFLEALNGVPSLKTGRPKGSPTKAA